MNISLVAFECQRECEIWEYIRNTNLFGIESSWLIPEFTRIQSPADMEKFDDFIIKDDVLEKWHFPLLCNDQALST